MLNYLFIFLDIYLCSSLYDEFLDKDLNIVASHASHEVITKDKEVNGLSVRSKFYSKSNKDSIFRVKKTDEGYSIKNDEGYLCSLGSKVILCDEEQSWALNPEVIGFKVYRDEMCLTVKKKGKLVMKSCDSKKEKIYQTFDFLIINKDLGKTEKKEKKKKEYNLTIINTPDKLKSKESSDTGSLTSLEDIGKCESDDKDSMKCITKSGQDISVEVEHVKRGLLDESSTPTDYHFKKEGHPEQSSTFDLNLCEKELKKLKGVEVEKSIRVHNPEQDSRDRRLDYEDNESYKSPSKGSKRRQAEPDSSLDLSLEPAGKKSNRKEAGSSYDLARDKNVGEKDRKKGTVLGLVSQNFLDDQRRAGSMGSFQPNYANRSTSCFPSYTSSINPNPIVNKPINCNQTISTTQRSSINPSLITKDPVGYTKQPTNIRQNIKNGNSPILKITDSSRSTTLNHHGSHLNQDNKFI